VAPALTPDVTSLSLDRYLQLSPEERARHDDMSQQSLPSRIQIDNLFGVIGALANSPAAARALKRAISDRRMYWRP
jgi:hypothetical protein